MSQGRHCLGRTIQNAASGLFRLLAFIYRNITAIQHWNHLGKEKNVDNDQKLRIQ